MVQELDFSDKNMIKEINEFLLSNKWAEYNQTIEWNIIRNEKIKFYLYSVNELKEIMWVCSLVEKKDGSIKNIYANRGPVLNYNDNFIIKKFIDEIKEWMFKHNYTKLIINPKIKEDILKNVMKKVEYRVMNKNDYINLKDAYKQAVIEIIYDENEMMKMMDYHIRRNTIKAYKNELKYKISYEIDIDKFYELYKDTSKRHEFIAHNIEYFKKILKVFKNKIIFIEVLKENIPIAMAIDLVYKGKLVYLYGASSTLYREKRGMYIVHWEAIKYCIKNHIKEYDMGGVFCDGNDIKSKDYGLYRLKKGYCYNKFQEYMPDIIINFN